MDDETMTLLTNAIKSITANIGAISAILISKGVCTQEELELFNRITHEQVEKDMGE